MEPAVTRLLTTERLARYVRLGGSSEAGWDLYVWNAQIGSAYLEALSWVEVGLRNASAQQMDHLRRRTDPAGEWLDPTNPWFNPWFQQGTVSSIKQARSRVSQPNQHPETGRVIAELTFGFWVRLYSRHYEASLWTPALRHVFPAKMARATVHDRLLGLTQLRNRVAHHEPIFEQDHEANLDSIIETLHWLDPAYAAAVQPVLRVAHVANQRP